VRAEDAGEQLDAGASEAFAVADHQVAHVYVRRRERVAEVAELLRGQPGSRRSGTSRQARQRPRSPALGELVAVSMPDRWFTYYYWLDDDRAPDYARTVDIHRKPGYDPVELFIDPDAARAPAEGGADAAQAQAGLPQPARRDPLDGLWCGLARPHHRRPRTGRVFITSDPDKLGPDKEVHALLVKEIVLAHLFG
jgi:hypothetical protein